MMAYLKLAVNLNDDESFKRIVNKPARGIGDTSLRVIEEVARKESLPLFKAASRPDLEQYGLKPAALTKIRAFCIMMLLWKILSDKEKEV